MMGLKEKEINIYDSFYSCKINSTYILILDKEYILPNMFEEGILGLYEHDFKFEVSKNELKTILERMKIVARNNKEGRIFIELKEDKVVVKNTDSQLASENIKAIVDKELIDVCFPVPVNYLSSIIGQLSGNTIRCYCTNDVEDFRAVKIEDETGLNFYVLILLEG
jgi:DNA polymerase III sliding clamp (beta) subunit (PCNA family)